MAALIRHVKLSLSKSAHLCSCNVNKLNPLSFVTSKRFLFSTEILGIESYKRSRINVIDSLGDSEASFRARVREMLQTEKYVFTEDLKKYVYLAKTDEDLETLISLVKKYHKQSQSGSLAISSFHFGPLVVRLLHMLQKADLALELFRDQELTGFFDEMTCKMVVMDMLYNAGRYDEALEIFSQLQQSPHRIGVDIVTLAIACLAKKGTPEAYSRMMELMKTLGAEGYAFSSRGVGFAALFALKQGKAMDALEILSIQTKRIFPAVGALNLRIMCYCKLDRIEDALPILQKTLKIDDPTSTRVFFFTDTIAAMTDAVQSRKSKELMRQFNSLKQALSDGGLINNLTLEGWISKPIARQAGPSDSFKIRNQSSVGGFRSRDFQARKFQNRDIKDDS